MTDIDRTLRAIRPRMREVIPLTYWLSFLFAVLNTTVGYLTFTGSILYTLKLVTIVPIQLWAIAFLVLGIMMAWALGTNNWKMTQSLHVAGIVVKSYWLAELLGSWILGGSPFALVMWIFIMMVQILVLRYFDGKPKFSLARAGSE